MAFMPPLLKTKQTNFLAWNCEDIIANFNFNISIRGKTIAQKSGRELAKPIEVPNPQNN